ncbi:MAG: hypothetical protein HIU91_15415 [Acidobacteria bacterium]|nr:hypothetical protein [Acidobacteriota bacterium]
MAAAHTIRVQIEARLTQRVPAALSYKIKRVPELFATGIAEVDEMLGGGIPRGSISEISGTVSTGKTSFALSAIASITRLGNACAWVDLNDALSPETIAAAGAELRHLLWLRMLAESGKKVADKPWPQLEQALKATDLVLQTGGFGAIVLDMSDVLLAHARHIPLATWYRFRLAAEKARTALIVLTQSPCTSSCASLVLSCDAGQTASFSCSAETPLFERQQFQLSQERNRYEGCSLMQKKPVQRVSWLAETLWVREQ